MIKEITAKTILSSSKQPDPWFGIKYTMNLYRGCQHQCIYCDSRSECYQIENFADILVKVNAIDLLRHELAHKRMIGTVGTGSMKAKQQQQEEHTAEENPISRVLCFLFKVLPDQPAWGYPTQ